MALKLSTYWDRQKAGLAKARFFTIGPVRLRAGARGTVHLPPGIPRVCRLASTVAVDDVARMQGASGP
jgi:hypothetical protein